MNRATPPVDGADAPHGLVDLLLAAAGLPADAAQRQGLATAQRLGRPWLEALYAMPIPREVPPGPGPWGRAPEQP